MDLLFRNSMFGFNKIDVANFITKLSRENEKALQQKEKEIEELKRGLQELEQKTADREESLEKEKALFQTKKDDLEKIRTLAGRAKDTSNRVEALAAENFAHAEKMNADIQTLTKKAEKAEEYREKALKFDRLASVLSDIVSGQEEKSVVCEEEEIDELPQELISLLSVSHFEKQKAAAGELNLLLDEIGDAVALLSLEEK